MIQKLFLIIVVIAAVWFCVKAYRRFEAAQRRGEARGREQKGDTALVAQDMVKCPRCGTYVAGPHPACCARQDCPYAA